MKWNKHSIQTSFVFTNFVCTHFQPNARKSLIFLALSLFFLSCCFNFSLFNGIIMMESHRTRSSQERILVFRTHTPIQSHSYRIFNIFAKTTSSIALLTIVRQLILLLYCEFLSVKLYCDCCWQTSPSVHKIFHCN